MSSLFDVIMIVTGGLHILLLIVAPYSKRYFILKKIAFVAGVIAAILTPICYSSSLGLALTAGLAVAAVAIAHVAWFAALASANFSLANAWKRTKAFYLDPPLRAASGAGLLFILFGAVYEELIWRQLLFTLLGGGIVANLAVTLLFCACHISLRRKIRYPRMIDLALFSLTMGFCFQATGNLTFVILIHWLKNALIYLMRSDLDPQYRETMQRVRTKLRARIAGLIPARRPVAASGAAAGSDEGISPSGTLALYMAENGRISLTTFCVGRAAATAGEVGFLVALNWWLFSATSNVFYLAVVNLILPLPRLLLGPAAGIAADRYGSRKVLVISGLLCAASMMAAAGLIDVASEPNARFMIILSLIVLVQSVGATISKPAELVVLSSAFGGSLKAVSTFRFCTDGALQAMPIAAGVLLPVLSIRGIAVACGLAYVAATTALLMVRERRTNRTSIERGFVHGFRGMACIARPEVRQLCAVVILVECCVSAMSILLTPYAKDHLGLDATGFGLVVSITPIGSVLASGAVGMLLTRLPEERVITAAIFLTGAAYLTLGATSRVWMGCIALAVLGASASAAGVCIQTLFMKKVPEATLGVFFGSLRSLNMAMRPLVLWLFAYLCTGMGIAQTFCIAGTVVLAIALYRGLANHDIRTADEPESYSLSKGSATL